MLNQKSEKIVVANFKMNLVMKYELEHWLTNFKKAAKGINQSGAKLVLCPPAVYLEKFIKTIKNKGVEFGLQNCFWEIKGSFTGEVSPEMIKTTGGKFVILGHSERRKYLGETNQMIAKKISASLKVGIFPVLCIGEELNDRKRGLTLKVISRQLEECLFFLTETKLEKIIICYEPIWAISSNQPNFLPTSNDVLEAKLLIRKILVSKYGRKKAEEVPILYGGSVNTKNVKEVCLEPGMNGVLVGNTSLFPYDLIKLVEMVGRGK